MPDEFDMPEPTRLMLAGDWHGNADWAIKALKHARLAECDAIVHLGDFGFWPRLQVGQMTPGEQGYIKGLSDYLRGPCGGKMPLYWIDGNHENHDLLNPGSGSEVIRHLPRGHRWSWWGKTWMAVGGGVSVDKKWRKPGIDWFPEETLTPRQWEHCMREGKVDIVVAHDAPDGVDIPGIHAKEKTGETESFFPAEQIMESWEHRGLLAEIVEETRPELWFAGHYHVRYSAIRHGKDGWKTRVEGLDRDGSSLDRNTLILEPQ